MSRSGGSIYKNKSATAAYALRLRLEKDALEDDCSAKERLLGRLPFEHRMATIQFVNRLI